MMMAPIGYYVVIRHVRISENGIKHVVKTHRRKNRGLKISLLPENLLYLFWAGEYDYPRLGGVNGFDEFSELDDVIQYWIEYWKSAGLPFPDDFDPFLVKVIIAVESSFNSKAKAKGSTARGLMQILAPTLRIMNGSANNGHVEIKECPLQLKPVDLDDPVIAIAAGVRWLFHKHQQLLKHKKIKDKGTWSTIKYYHSWDEQGDNYVKKIRSYYKLSGH